MNNPGTLKVGMGLAVLAFFAFESRSAACTTFCLTDRGAPLVGKSYDWHMGAGRVVVNKRGVEKRAVVLGGKAVTWTSKHASVTFNQYGREFPNGGMNDAGLVVEILWLDASRAAKPDARPVINELQWIQYQLDTSQSLADVTRAARRIRVTPIAAKVHYMVCDVDGKCGAFEYIAGKLVITSGGEMPHRVLANDTYAVSLEHAKKIRGLGGARRPPTDKSSKSRYVVAALATKHRAPGKSGVRRAFAALDAVKNGDYSKWQIVYDSRRRRVHFRSLGYATTKTVDLRRFKPSCKAPVVTFNINSDASGDVTGRFAPYSASDNRSLVETNMKGTNVPAFAAGLVAAYPRTTKCVL